MPFEKVYLKSSDISSLIDSISLNERYNSKDKRFNRIVKERKDFLEFKPYLFPLSSMTDKQKEEHKDLLDNQYSFDANGNIFTLQDFYCKYHFDYRGFIEKGLAIDATGLNIY